MTNSAPTQSRLLELKDQRELAQEGYDLLERKREVLINELLGRIHELKDLRGNFLEALSEGLQAFKMAYVKMGEINMGLALKAAKRPPVVESIERTIMGVVIQEFTDIKVETIEKSGLEVSSGQLNHAVRKVETAFKALLEYVEKYNAVWRIAMEIKKTLRRVNTLDNIFIPQYNEEIKWIEDTLAEEEREQFFRQKQVKKKMAH